MDAIGSCRVVAMPYPGRGHINAMMNFCHQLVSKTDNMVITFVVTQEWVGLIDSDHQKPHNKLQFAAIPNVIPSERVRSNDWMGFMEAVATKMEAPFELLLDQLEPPGPSFLIADTFLLWPFNVGNRRNIPVASFWPMSATAFSVFYHFDRFLENGHCPLNFSENGHEQVEYIPGVPAMPLMDLPSHVTGTKQEILERTVKMFSWVPKGQYFLLPTIYELECQVLDVLRQNLSIPVYPIGPAIPYFNLGDNSEECSSNEDATYIRWLDCQPCSSVLYVSLGSFLSVSSAQMDEIAAGLCESGVRFLWVARDETERLKEACGDKGLLVPWCDQLRVLCRPSIGGFWTHCGWNSVREGVFAGVPFLAFPLVVDQFPNRKLIVEDWKIGCRVKEKFREDDAADLVTREEIAKLVRKFMDLESTEGKEMRRRAKELQETCQRSISKDGSSEANINSFVKDISLSFLHSLGMESNNRKLKEATNMNLVVAIPYPGRGHINPMMELCKWLVSITDDILITFVVTEEWLSFIGSDPKPEKIRFGTIPSVIPSELVRASNMMEFIEALLTNMEAPFEKFLDQLEQPPAVIIADTYLLWAVGVGNRRNIPVASFWPMSAMVFLMFHHLDLLKENGQFLVDLLERGHERADYIPGVSSTRLVDVPSFINGSNPYMLRRITEILSWVPKAQYLLFPSIYELESQAIDAIKAEFSFPVYAIGPAIPHLKLEDNSYTSSTNGGVDYLRWLDDQPSQSVLYISMGSYLSFSSDQMDGIAGGLHDSGVRFLWIARGETYRLKEVCGDKGLVVPWCDQLRVLCHPSIAGFWTHCGWNSIREGVFAGVPFLTYPIAADQRSNSKLIVEDWKVGWRVEKEFREENLVSREEIGVIVQKVMDSESYDVREMRRRVKELQELCRRAISEDGSSENNIKSFIRDTCFARESGL